LHAGSAYLVVRDARRGGGGGTRVLLALQPEPAGLIEAAGRPGAHARALILSDQARRYLTLQYRSYPTEFMGCMIGEIPRQRRDRAADRPRGRGARALHRHARRPGTDL